MGKSIARSVLGSASALLWLAGCSSSREPSRASGVESVGHQQAALSETNYALDTTPDFSSPERGVAYNSDETAQDPVTLKFLYLNLQSVCNSAALAWNGRVDTNTSQVLKDWANAAIALRDLGYKVIFRPRYDGGTGAPNTCGKVEGNSFAIMQNHAQAIGKMLADPEIKPIVANIQMGYLGSWGEWNTAGTGCNVHIYKTCQAFAPVLLADDTVSGTDRIHFAKYVIDTYRSWGVDRTIELRRPEFFNDLVANFSVPASGMGFYNDCFMASATDGGTFSHLRWDYDDYHELYPGSAFSTPDAAKAFLQAQAPNGSMGGESCGGSGSGADWATNPASVPDRMNADSFQYLHGAWATTFRQTMINANQWDTIKSRLGYRYQVTKVTYPDTATAGSSITVSVDLTNSGFARPPYDRDAYIVLQGPTSYIVAASNPRPNWYTQLAPTTQQNATVRSWDKGTPKTFSQTFPAPTVPGTYTIKLYIPDKECVTSGTCTDAVKNSYALRLATLRGGVPVFEPGTSADKGTNNLGVSFAITAASCAGGGNVIQNCDFSGGTTSWLCGSSGTAAATCSGSGGVHQTVITSPGAFAYSVQPNQQNLPLTQGTTYTVSFDARSSVANRPMSISITKNHDDFASYSGSRPFTLGTTMTTQTFNFTMTGPSDANAKIEFDLGANGSNTVFLDNVVLKPAGG